MFVRQVTAHYKPEKFEFLNDKFEKEVIPLLRAQKGFRDELSFFDDEKKEAYAMSFWETRQDAEMYERELYPQITDKMKDVLTDKPIVRSFEVANSTWYGIHA